MSTAKDVLSRKKALGVITVLPHCSVRDACRVMRDRRIGALLVAEGETLHGIVTERDVMNLVVAVEKDPSTTEVAEVMTRKVIVVRSDRSLEEVEADAIRFALSHYHNQMSEVARRLRIGRSTLYRKLDGLGLAVADEAGP